MKTIKQNITYFFLFFISVILISGNISCIGGSSKKEKQSGDTTVNNTDKQISNKDTIAKNDNQDEEKTASLKKQSKQVAATQNIQQTPQAVSVTTDKNKEKANQIHKQVTALTSQTFDETIKSGVTMVDFWAVWCKPCRMEGPIIEEINTEIAGRAKVCKMDIDKNKTIADRFNIQYIPTIIIFNNGKIVKQFTGFTEKDVLFGALTNELK